MQEFITAPLTHSPFSGLLAKIGESNKNGLAKLATGEALSPQAKEALAVRPKVAGSRRFYSRGILYSLALFLANDTTKEQIDQASAYADGRLVKNDNGEPEAFMVAFGIEKGRNGRKDLLRGTITSAVPKNFDRNTDIVLPLMSTGVKYTTAKGAGEVRSSLGVMSGRLLKPINSSNIWRFWPDGLAPAREIEIFNQLMVQEGQASQCVKPIVSDLYSPGIRLRTFTATRLDEVRDEQTGELLRYLIGNTDGKLETLTASSQKPKIGKAYQFWFREFEGFVSNKLAGEVGSVDPTTKPTVLEMGYSLDYEAALGVAKEFMSPESIEEIVEQLLDTAMDMNHPTYAYLVGVLQLFTEGEEYDYKVAQVIGALELAGKLAKEEIAIFYREVDVAFDSLEIPNLEGILGEGVSVDDFRSASAGDDPLTRLIAAALEEAFDFAKPLHVHVRNFLLVKAVREDELKRKEAANAAPMVELPKVLMTMSFLGIKVRFDAVAMLGLSKLTLTETEARVKALVNALVSADEDMNSIVGALVGMGVQIDLQNHKHLDRLKDVVITCGEKIAAYIEKSK